MADMSSWKNHSWEEKIITHNKRYKILALQEETIYKFSMNYMKRKFKYIFIFLILISTVALRPVYCEENEDKKTQTQETKIEAQEIKQTLAQAPSGVKSDETPVESDPGLESMQFLLKRNFAPPLSLFESIHLTENIMDLINPSMEKFKGPRKDKALHLMTLITDYVKLTDDRSSSLLFYKWYFIGKNQEMRETMEEVVFKPTPVIRNVSAISFEAEKADVNIHFMKVTDLEGNTTSFKVDKCILNGLPRKEVCFLYFPTTIKQIVVDYSTKSKGKSRLTVYAGVTDRPEYGKAALYYLSRGRKEIENDAFENAKKDLVKAREYLIKFNLNQRK